MSDVKITSLEKSFGANKVLKGVSLAIPSGEFTVLVGPSGCGKSTLLRTIAGLEEADSGLIEIGGRVVNAVRPRDRDIAMVFQNYALYPYLTVADNIAFGLRARKTPEPDVQTRVREAADMLGISGLLDRMPRQLSGGQRQRVAIGRAIVRRAKLFLFDEPLSNLDAQLRDEMRSEIKRLHHELATTMIYVTHDQIEAMTLADRIVLMKEGEIEQQGAPLELFEKPATRFVAGFLGSPQINFIEGTLDSAARAIRLKDGTVLVIPLGAPVERRAGSIVLGIRPQHIARAKAAAATQGSARVETTVELVQPTGTRTYVTFPLGGEPGDGRARGARCRSTRRALAVDIDMHRRC